MKKIRYSRMTDNKRGLKRFGISQKSSDSESITRVRKQFEYQISWSELTEPQDVPPEIHIFKEYDSKRKIERFRFEVKGTFYMTHHRMLVKVDFHHTLYISILWKNKNFSPKKSAVLT